MAKHASSRSSDPVDSSYISSASKGKHSREKREYTEHAEMKAHQHIAAKKAWSSGPSKDNLSQNGSKHSVLSMGQFK